MVLMVSVAFLGSLTGARAYDVSQATRYANKWWNSRNSFFHDCGGLDCANFVSQCLIAGGIDLKDGPSYNIYGRHCIVRCGDQPYPGLGENLEWHQNVTLTRKSVGWDDELYDISSQHPYPDDYDSTWVITKSGALKMKVHFLQFETEYYHDYVHIYDGSDDLVSSYTGSLSSFWSDEVDGETVKIRLVTDGANTGYGFDIDKYKYKHIPDAPDSIGAGDVIMFGNEDDCYKHSVIVVGGSGNNAYCNAHSRNHWHISWTDWVDGTFSNPFTVVSFFEIPDGAGAQANLTPYTPPGWEAPLIASSVCGTYTSGPHLLAGEPTYIDFAINNDGCADLPDEVKYALYIDNSRIETWSNPGLWYGYHIVREDYTHAFSEGWHTLKITADPDYYWSESDESDNSYWRKWYWGRNGVEEPSDTNQVMLYSMSQNFPNPFFEGTAINYTIALKGDVWLCIYDISGRLVWKFVDENKNPGQYKVVWDGRNETGEKVSPGIYFARLRSGDFRATKKMIKT